MATWPAKTNYATGDVLTAAQMNTIGDELNDLHTNGSNTSYGFAAGKNTFINGDMGIWQRGTSISLPNGTWTYGADRWAAYSAFSVGSSTFSQQTFTPGTAPVSGYEGTYFARLTLGTIATFFQMEQRIEDVRTYAGQTATVSFWAKSSGTPTVKVTTYQNFGTGGSAGVSTDGTSFALTSSWTRYTATLTFPSISGKTIGTNSALNVGLVSVSGTLNGITIDTWGWQIEAGSSASSFQTATGTKQGELAACQRYFYGQTIDGGTTGVGNFAALGMADGTTTSKFPLRLPVTMRTAPSLTFSSQSGFRLFDFVNASITTNAISLYASSATNDAVTISASVASGLTQYRPYVLIAPASGTSYIYASSEL